MHHRPGRVWNLAMGVKCRLSLIARISVLYASKQLVVNVLFSMPIMILAYCETVPPSPSILPSTRRSNRIHITSSSLNKNVRAADNEGICFIIAATVERTVTRQGSSVRSRFLLCGTRVPRRRFWKLIRMGVWGVHSPLSQ